MSSTVVDVLVGPDRPGKPCQLARHGNRGPVVAVALADERCEPASRTKARRLSHAGHQTCRRQQADSRDRLEPSDAVDLFGECLQLPLPEESI